MTTFKKQNSIKHITQSLMKKHKIREVTDLVMNGLSPKEIENKKIGLSITQVYDIIGQYRQANRWAAYYGHVETRKSTMMILEDLAPDFDHLINLSQKLKKEVNNVPQRT